MVACSRHGAVRALARTAGPGAGGGGCFPPARPRMVRITPRLHYHFPVMATGGLFPVSRDPSGNGSRRSSPLAPWGLLPGRVRCQCVASPAADGRGAPGAVCVPGGPPADGKGDGRPAYTRVVSVKGRDVQIMVPPVRGQAGTLFHFFTSALPHTVRGMTDAR
ncbi:hypothetical protein [Komagataeibacter europaeus]|uniref:hypothetical protein n=1 Tax=Komagataeibacter europaeus TaxID=33995 RepID=UPI00128FB1B7|nr:hypothetical protein [Komagataeibacter europaeus]